MTYPERPTGHRRRIAKILLTALAVGGFLAGCAPSAQESAWKIRSEPEQTARQEPEARRSTLEANLRQQPSAPPPPSQPHGPPPPQPPYTRADTIAWCDRVQTNQV